MAPGCLGPSHPFRDSWRPMAISGTDLLEVPTIYKAYFLGLCKAIYPQKYGLLWYSTSILGSWNSHWTMVNHPAMASTPYFRKPPTQCCCFHVSFSIAWRSLRICEISRGVTVDMTPDPAWFGGLTPLISISSRPRDQVTTFAFDRWSFHILPASYGHFGLDRI